RGSAAGGGEPESRAPVSSGWASRSFSPMRCRKSGSVSRAEAIAFPANLIRRLGAKRAYCLSWAGSSPTVSPPKPSETIWTTRRRTPSGSGRSSTSAAPSCGPPPVVSTIRHTPMPVCHPAYGVTVSGACPRSGAGTRPVHEFHLVHGVAPAAPHRLDGLTEHLALLDLRLAGQVQVDVLDDLRGAGHVEAREVAAEGAAPPGDAGRQGDRHRGCSPSFPVTAARRAPRWVRVVTLRPGGSPPPARPRARGGLSGCVPLRHAL